MHAKVVEVGAVDNVQTRAQVHGAQHKVALDLLAQPNERILNLNVVQLADLRQRVEAHVDQLVLARHVRKLVDAPCRLVVTHERQCRIDIHQRLERAADQSVHLLPPREHVAPRRNVVPEIRKPFAPPSENALNVGCQHVSIATHAGVQLLDHKRRFLELDDALEGM